MRQVIASSFRCNQPDEIDQALKVDEFISNHDLHPLKAGCETWSCAWAPDCSYFAWSCGRRIVQLVPWSSFRKTSVKNDSGKAFDDNASVQKNYTLDCGELVWSVAFGLGTLESSHSENASFRRFHFGKDFILATGLQSGKIKIWDCYTGNLLMELLDHKAVVRDVNFALNGSLMLVSASRDGTLKLWDLYDDGNMVKTLQVKSKWIYGSKWSPGAKQIACVGSHRLVLIWNMADLSQPPMKLNGHNHDVVSCDFSPDGALLATASYDTRVIIWDSYSGEALKEMGHLIPAPRPIFAGGANDFYVRSVSFSRDGFHIASVADDGYVRFWDILDVNDPEMIANIPNGLCCRFSPDGSVLAVGTRNGSVSFFAPPQRVESLQHVCRMAIRSILLPPGIDKLKLPLKMKKYLLYKEW